MKRFTIIALAAAAVLIGLSAAVVFAGAFIINPGFEMKDQVDGVTPDLAPWELKNKSRDKLLCTTEAKPIPTYEGDCAFKFKGGEGESSKLVQLVDYLTRGIVQRAVGDYYVCYGVRAYSKSPASKLRLTVTVTVSGDLLPRVVKYKHNGKTQTDHDPEPEWVDVGCTLGNPVDGVLIVSGELLDTVSIVVKNKSASGVMYIDGAYSVLLSPPSARTGAVPR